jgi:hypothetical protein
MFLIVALLQSCSAMTGVTIVADELTGLQEGLDTVGIHVLCGEVEKCCLEGWHSMNRQEISAERFISGDFMWIWQGCRCARSANRNFWKSNSLEYRTEIGKA